MIWLVILFAIVNGALSLAGGLGLLFWPAEKIRRINRWLIPLTAGVLLATALLDILPETLPYFYTKTFVWVFIAIAGFFFAAQITHRLEAASGSEQVNRRAVTAIGVTSVIHNLVYGALIGVFTNSFNTGLAAAVILALSDIPHELGVSSLLLDHKLTRRQVLQFQIWVTVPTLVGAVAGHFMKFNLFQALPYILSLLAGWFIYIVIHDIFGQMEHLDVAAHPAKQLVAFVIGTLFVVWMLNTFGNVPFGYHTIYTDMPL
jgi:zinc transporter ZupT